MGRAIVAQHGQMDRHCLSSHKPTLFLFLWSRGKKIVDEQVRFIKVPTVCVHKGLFTTICVCWHHTEFCPLPGRQRQTSRCHHGELAFLRRERERHTGAFCSYELLSLPFKGWLGAFLSQRAIHRYWGYEKTLNGLFPFLKIYISLLQKAKIWIRFSVSHGGNITKKERKISRLVTQSRRYCYLFKREQQLWHNCAPPNVSEIGALKRAQVANWETLNTITSNVPIKVN